jgi:hypothetical protein
MAPKRTCGRPSSHLAGPKIESIDINMLVRLSRTKRLRAGWLIALIYLLCVLAPTLSFAWPGSHAVSLCLTEGAHVAGDVHIHTDAGIQHIRIEGHAHAHSSGHSQVNSDGNQLGARFAPEKAPHSSNGQCCGLMCVTALPATLIDVVKPFAPTALCEVEGYRKVTDNAPPQLYRPPIS